MSIRKLCVASCLALVLAAPLACGQDQEEGPAERLGQKVDEAAKDVAAGVNQAAQTASEKAAEAEKAAREAAAAAARAARESAAAAERAAEAAQRDLEGQPSMAEEQN